MVASPKRVDPAVYDAIYALPGGAPGYDRYFQLARNAKYARDPLRYLSSRQDAVWGVGRALRECRATRILEVGCGLGYLTFALRRAGYNARGIDIAEEAIAFALENYGDYFTAESVESHVLASKEKYDAVVMVELIEHLEEPIELLRGAMSLLSPDGVIILTTPNRSYLGYEEPWATDLPPVHLWWFSEESLREVARNLACDLRFVDFSEYNTRYPIWQAYRNLPVATLDEAGRVIRKEGRAKASLRRLGILHETYWVISRISSLAKRPQNSRRQAIVAILRPGTR